MDNRHNYFIRKIILNIALLLVFILVIYLFKGSKNSLSSRDESFRIMFYNAENFFDTIDDPSKNDNEYLPQSGRRWNSYKYKNKLANIYKVIMAVGEERVPEIIGLGEIENYQILEDLISKTPLLKYNYNIIHFDSPDFRGLDVAILYQSKYFKPVYKKNIPISFPSNPDILTRDILYVKGIVKGIDTLHLFINHWPSRWGSQKKTEFKRLVAAKTLKKYVDSLYAINPTSKIVITGDFNDTPTDVSISEILRAKFYTNENMSSMLYYLPGSLQENISGTIKYNGNWDVFDQFIVSGSLLDKTQKIYVNSESSHIYSSEFLVVEDQKYFDVKTFRTYIGYKYQGGFSDHLPVYLDIYYNNKNN